MIKFITHKDIDKNKWDACLIRSPHGLIYGYSWYLDHMAPNWAGLVEDDYRAVMPLFIKTKWRVPYITQPPFCQQLGVFSIDESPETSDRFLRCIPWHFTKVDLSLHSRSISHNSLLTSRMNYILPLQNDYTTLYQGYDINHKKNIAKAYKEELILKYISDAEIIIKIYKAVYGKLYPKFDNRIYTRLEALIDTAKSKNAVELLTVVDKDGEILAGAVFMIGKGRAHYIMGAPTDKGREKRAVYFLIDSFIRNHAGEHLVLDFEGSEIPNVAYFYKNFGAVPEPYFVYRRAWPGL